MSNSGFNDLSDTVVADSDYLTSDSIPDEWLITITGGSKQKINGKPRVVINHDVDPDHPWLMSKGMVRLVASKWGLDGSQWVGRKLLIYAEPRIIFGGKPDPGIRIKGMSHIDSPFTFEVKEQRTLKIKYDVQPIKSAEPAAPAFDPYDILKKLEAVGVTQAAAEDAVGASVDQWQPSDRGALGKLFKAAQAGGAA